MVETRSRARDRVALTTWPTAEQAKITSTVRIEWDRVRLVHQNIAPLSVVGFAFAKALAANPVVNRRVALWSLRPHKTIRLSFAVEAEGELRIAVVDKADNLDCRQFQRALIGSVRTARHGTGPLARAISIVEWLPVALGRPIVRLGSLITAGFGIGLVGVPGAPFGAVLISSLDRFKANAVYVPFVPFTRCTIVCSVGKIWPAPVVRNNCVEVVDVVDINVTIDHRVADGSQLAAFLNSFESACYERKEVLEGPKTSQY
jgi:hypothetical protein